MENKKALVWLRDDFRVNRNNSVIYASENNDQVSAIYIFNLEEYATKYLSLIVLHDKTFVLILFFFMCFLIK